MGYVPANAKWWLADLVVEFTLEDADANLVHYNLTLVRADSAEEAYVKSVKFGEQQESTYMNTDGKSVKARFRGLRDLLVVYDELQDGAELLYEEESDVSEERIVETIKAKENLSVFEPYVPPSI